MDKLRFGIIGVGGMGSFHAKYLDTIEGVKLTAVADVEEAKLQAFANRPDVRAFARGEDLLDSRLVDAVIIATPHYFHPAIARGAMERGIHVLCEKPVAVTIGEARKLNETYARFGHLKFGVMFQTRTVAMYQKLRDLVQSGELGEITRITWLVTDWFRTWSYYASGGWRATWAGEGGGVLINQCPHNLDLLQWIPNMMPTRVTAAAFIAKTHPIEVEDEVSAILEYPSGAVGHFVTSTGEAPGTNRLEICGDRGKIVAEGGKLLFSRTRLSVRQIREESPESFPRAETWAMEIPYATGRPEGHKVVTENFVAAVLRNEPMLAPGVEGVRGLEIGNAMLMSGLTRRPVDLPVDAEAYERFIRDNIARHGGRKSQAPRSGPTADLSGSFKL